MSRLLSRVVAVPSLVVALAASAAVVTADPAFAATRTLNVVGTSDVFDSFLIQNVIKPDFEAANPDVTLNYISKGTGAAIAYAEAGSADALVVHAASLENQFVGQGYSLESYGRAIFYGDYVLLGPASDPAKVLNGTTHDIVGAFQKIAATGVKGKADFVSRGGTPGTTVQEHAIWALTNTTPLCTVSDVNGGGKAPSTASGACPPSASNPAWYHTTGLTQGPNVLAGDTCNFPNAHGGNDCYVFTDRGTFQYLRSTNQIQSLGIQVRDNAASKTGGSTILTNSFHAYGVNPAKFPGVPINSADAQRFLEFLTSPTEQSAIGAYLANDADGAPFLPDAAPQITTSKFPRSVKGGAALSLTGTVTNVVPGTPPLSDVTVSLNFVPSATPDANPTVVATTSTNATGAFKIGYRPRAAGTYTLSTPPLTKIEDGGLTPPFGDLLQAGTTPTSAPVGVTGIVNFGSLKGGKGVVTGTATFTPAGAGNNATLVLYAAPGTDPTATLSPMGSLPISAGATSRAFSYTLSPGPWVVQLHYVNNGVITEAATRVKPVTVT